MNQRNEIVNIKVSNLYPHPDNPRKDLGDLTELAESIQKSGIMQNLTVMPIDCTHEEKEKQSDPNNESLSSDFIVLIGHRRMAAAKKVGLEKVPCMIVSNISKKEQISIMLEENMQRNDLTIYEQAQGFQMMLDLGETEESIAEKTGFSRTTIRRRLNIAKLDQEELKRKEQSEAFQLTLKDLYALEQLENVKDRDKILREATDSSNLQWRISQKKEEIEREKHAKELVEKLEAIGVTKTPKDYEKTMYSGNWEIVEWMNLQNKPQEKLSKKKFEGCFYYKDGRYLKVIRKKQKGKSQPKTKRELEEEERKRRNKELKNIKMEMNLQMNRFVRSVVSGEVRLPKERQKLTECLWGMLLEMSQSVSKIALGRFLLNTNDWYSVPDEEKQKTLKEVDAMSVPVQMLIEVCMKTENMDLANYYNEYSETNGKLLRMFTEFLENYGFSFSRDELYEVMDGTHENYKKEDA